MTAWTDVSSKMLFRQITVMLAIARSSGIGSVAFLFDGDLSPVAHMLSSLLTGEKAVILSQINVVSERGAGQYGSPYDLQERERNRTLTAASNKTRRAHRLVEHKHSSELRRVPGMVLTCLHLLTDIISASPSVLPDYRPIAQFITNQLDLAIGQGTGVAGYGYSLSKMDSNLILSYLAFLTVVIRAQKKVTAALAAPLLKRGEIPRAGADGVLRELVSSKLLTLADVLAVLGETLVLRSLIRLLLEASPVLGNVATSSASGALSFLMEPRAAALVRFIVVALGSVAGRRPIAVDYTQNEITGLHFSAPVAAAALQISGTACQIILNISKANPQAVRSLLSRREVEEGVIGFLCALISMQPSMAPAAVRQLSSPAVSNGSPSGTAATLSPAESLTGGGGGGSSGGKRQSPAASKKLGVLGGGGGTGGKRVAVSESKKKSNKFWDDDDEEDAKILAAAADISGSGPVDGDGTRSAAEGRAAHEEAGMVPTTHKGKAGLKEISPPAEQALVSYVDLALQALVVCVQHFNASPHCSFDPYCSDSAGAVRGDRRLLQGSFIVEVILSVMLR